MRTLPVTRIVDQGHDPKPENQRLAGSKKVRGTGANMQCPLERALHGSCIVKLAKIGLSLPASATTPAAEAPTPDATPDELIPYQ
jgi:hypothetical protein